MTNTVEINWTGKMSFESVGKEGNLLLDADEKVGGQGKGLRPKALMLTALGGCTAMDIASLLKKMRAEVSDFKIEVQAEMTEEHPKFYNKTHLIYKFYGSDFKKDKIEKAVNLSKERYCGVMEMFRKFAAVTTEIKYFEK